VVEKARGLAQPDDVGEAGLAQARAQDRPAIGSLSITRIFSAASAGAQVKGLSSVTNRCNFASVPDSDAVQQETQRGVRQHSCCGRPPAGLRTGRTHARVARGAGRRKGGVSRVDSASIAHLEAAWGREAASRCTAQREALRSLLGEGRVRRLRLRVRCCGVPCTRQSAQP
jgi:hypothetical protein